VTEAMEGLASFGAAFEATTTRQGSSHWGIQ
jgi:hypothetical protein